MNLATSILILTLAGIPALPALATTEAPVLIAKSANIGMTKAQVRQRNGKPTRTSKDGNTWFYGTFAIQFTNGRVSGFPGSVG